MEKFVIIFLDEILIYSKLEEEHDKQLRLVLPVLRENQLYANLSKCSFYHRKIQYLGYVMFKEGIAVDPRKIDVIMGWNTPRIVSKVRSFMGLARYYRRDIKGFSKLAHPTISLQKEGVKFEWTP